MSSQTSGLIITVYIDNKPFEIDCDTGIQDVAWVALSACHLYGQEMFPTSKCLPIMARNKNNEILHPKMSILQNREKIGNEMYVKIKKKYGTIGSELNEEEKEWYNNAFEEGRLMQLVTVTLRPINEQLNLNNKFRIEYDFEIDNTALLFFGESYPNKIMFTLNETKDKDRRKVYECSMKIPIGTLRPSNYQICEKKGTNWGKGFTDFSNVEVKVKKFPEILTEKEKEMYLRQKEDMIREKENKIKQDILKADELKKKEDERLIKLRDYISKVPFTLEEIYDYCQSELSMDEQELVEIFELLERGEYLIFRKLYEIFSDYCKFFLDNETNTIDGCAENNFLHSFFENRPNLEDINDVFLREYIPRTEKETTDIDFREFVFIIVFLLASIVRQKNIKILTEIQAIYDTHVEKLKNFSYKLLFKNDEINKLIIKYEKLLSEIFNTYSKKKDKTEIEETKANELLEFANVLCKIFNVNLGDLTVGEANTQEKNVDYFDFLRIIIAMAINIYTVKAKKEKEAKLKETKEKAVKEEKNVKSSKVDTNNKSDISQNDDLKDTINEDTEIVIDEETAVRAFEELLIKLKESNQYQKNQNQNS